MIKQRKQKRIRFCNPTRRQVKMLEITILRIKKENQQMFVVHVNDFRLAVDHNNSTDITIIFMKKPKFYR